jgi:hypothetical protein
MGDFEAKNGEMLHFATKCNTFLVSALATVQFWSELVSFEEMISKY